MTKQNDKQMKHKLSFLLLILIISSNIFCQNKSDFRDDIDVLHYTINLNITDFKNKSISGNTILNINLLKESRNTITLDFLGLTVDSVFADNKKAEFKHENALLKIKTDNKKPVKAYELNVYYHGSPPKNDSWGGFFFKNNYAFNMGVAMDAKPHSFGRVWYPCIDKLSEKATYNFNITVPNGYTAVCSGILNNIVRNKSKTLTFKWEMKKEISAYLTSVAVGIYKKYLTFCSTDHKTIPIEVYVNPHYYNNVAASFVNIEKAVKCFSKYFGAYPWGRVGYVTMPRSSGAMEHVCNIAYPEYAVNGTTDREMLMVHELAHSWFGNLVTCKTPEDMWLNEGIASFAEVVFKEYVYGKLSAKNYVRDNHESVLTNCHIYDNGYMAIYGVSHQHTYSKTVYDKGSDVTHTLRGYLGDKLFFESLTAYLQEFSFKSASTSEFCNFLSQYTKTDLKPFFETWVYEAGFPHFSIKSFSAEKRDKEYRVTINVSQKLKERKHIGQNNKAEITFFDKKLAGNTQIINFSGEKYTEIFTVPFKPENVFFDLEEKISDATIDNYKIINEIGRYAFPNTDFSIEINKLSDSVLVRSTLNYISASAKNTKFTVNESSYWSITGVNEDLFSGKGIFSVNNIKNGFGKKIDNTILLYRKTESENWEEIKIKIDKTDMYSGNLVVENFKFGDYILAYDTP